MMDEEFVRKRITQLRMQRDVSSREMSLSLGQNEGYITQIENGYKMPSLSGLFYICQYFGITPQQFFDESSECPKELQEAIACLKKLDAATLSHITVVLRDLAGRA